MYLILVDFPILFWLKMVLLLNFLLRSRLLPLPLVAMVTTSLVGHIFICDRSVSSVPRIEQLRHQARLPFPPHLLRLSFHTLLGSSDATQMCTHICVGGPFHGDGTSA